MSKLIENAPFRYDTVGSFLRPERLKVARAAYEKDTISYEELKAVEDECIIDLVEKQKKVGLKFVTDGEFRRSWWHLDFMWGFDGISSTPVDKGYQFQGITTRAETARLTGKISCGNHPFLDHFKFLQEVAGPDIIARQTIPAPAQLLAELQRPDNRESTALHYLNTEDLFDDIVKAYQDFIQKIYDLGCRNLQIDDCTWGMLCDEHALKVIGLTEANAKEAAENYLDLNNRAIQNAPKDLVVTTHVCRGNYRSKYASSGGYDPVAETLFAKANVSAFYLEFDDERSGGFEPLKHVTGNKKVVLGLICSKTGELEDKQAIIDRIHEAKQYIELDRLYLSPQCGFASTEEGNVLTEQEQWAKIKLVKEIAEEVWGK